MQTDILHNFLKGSISKSEFLQNLVELDQSTPERQNCFENIKAMENSQIKRIFETSDEDTKYNYYHYLRLFYFHAFQYEACTYGTSPKALQYLETANLISNTLEEILPNEDPLFSKYILGTLYYIKNDINNLSLVIDQYEEGDKNDLTYSNVDVLKRLYNGLISNKSVDYNRDY